MKVLIVGSGGREHALAWKVAQSPRVAKVFVAPGNAGTALEPRVENIPVDGNDLNGLLSFAQERGIGLTIVGPEDPLVHGIVDHFGAAGLRCFGPGAAAARLEGSKAYAKDFMARHHIPTAACGQYTEATAAIAFIRHHGVPIVIKADGLAAGKGVIIARTLREAETAVTDMLSGNVYGAAGRRVVIEEFLEGEEASFIVMADGRHVMPLATSQDHKAVGDGDAGPNTGGMGAYSPAPVIDPSLHAKVMDEIIRPTVEGMAAEGHPFTGFLYAGLMISPRGEVHVLEYNVRFGDPETQPVLMRLKSDLVGHCLAAMEGRLDQEQAHWDTRCSVGVVMAAEGYPGKYAKGFTIKGLDQPLPPETKVFLAGAAMSAEGIVTAGGRVLCVCALGKSVSSARETVYDICSKINWPGAFYRKDIGYRAVAREKR